MPDEKSRPTPASPPEDIFLDQDDILEVVEIPELGEHEFENTEQPDIDDEPDADAEPVEDLSVLTFTGHKDIVLQCAYHPKLNLISTAGVDDMAYLWNSTSGEIVATFAGHYDSIDCIGFNHDGAYLATGDLTGNIMIWKMTDYTKSGSFSLAGELSWMIWHHGCNVLLAATMDGQVSMVKVPSCEEKIVIASQYGSVCSAGALMPDGKRLICGFVGCLTVTDLKTTTRIHQVKTEAHGGIECVDVYKDNTLVACGHDSGALTLINTQNGKLVGVLTPSGNGNVEMVAFSKDGSLPLLACCKCDAVMVYDVGRQTLRHVFVLGSLVTLITWHPTRPVVYSSHSDGAVRAVDAREGTALAVYTGHKSTCCALDIAPNGTSLVTGSYDWTAKVFNITDT